jgi:hypothetical protein
MFGQMMDRFGLFNFLVNKQYRLVWNGKRWYRLVLAVSKCVSAGFEGFVVEFVGVFVSDDWIWVKFSWIVRDGGDPAFFICKELTKNGVLCF